MSNILKQEFFKGKAHKVAPKLLGKYLVRRLNGKNLTYLITEVETYDGFSDKASHASRGKTARNYPMYEKGGRWYVYFTYGMHWMLNIVTGPKDYPSAVLIRGCASINSKHETQNSNLTNGPAKLTKFLKIDNRFNNKKAAKNTGLWIKDIGVQVDKSWIKKGPRVGIAYAGPYWAKRRWRFFLER